MTAVETFRHAVRTGDPVALRAVLETHADLRQQINAPLFSFDCPAIVAAAGRGRAVVDVLLEFGADPNARSSWWAGGFGALDGCDAETAQYLIGRGARLDLFAAARLGMLNQVRQLLDRDAGLTQARFGDGQTALHAAATVEIAALLLDRGAEIDARDVDHESTPAQYLIKDHTEVTRYLVTRGCATDLLMAAALGDLELVKHHLARDPQGIRMRVDANSFPMKNPHAGGSIYIWTLGNHRSAHQVARHFGHPETVELLMAHSPADVQLTEACFAGDEAAVRALLAADPRLVEKITPQAKRLIVTAAEDNHPAAVRLMLEAGWPVDGGGGTTPLHFAAWHGNAAAVRALLERQPPLEARDPQFHGTPLGWAIHGSQNSWHCATGDYATTVELLVDAGAQIPEGAGGSAAVQETLRRKRK